MVHYLNLSPSTSLCHRFLSVFLHLSLLLQQKSQSLILSKLSRITPKPRSDTTTLPQLRIIDPIPMRIRGSTPAASSAVAAPSPSPSHSTPSSPSSCFSSSTHSTISNHSLASSSNSASCSSYAAADSPSKCEGLDLLVKAVYYVVAGSVVGVPYIQRRVIRRRKRASCYSNLIVRGSLNSEVGVKMEDGDEGMEEGKRKRRKTKGGMPWKIQDSVVLQSWKPPTPPAEKPASSLRSRRRGSGKNGKSGSG